MSCWNWGLTILSAYLLRKISNTSWAARQYSLFYFAKKKIINIDLSFLYLDILKMETLRSSSTLVGYANQNKT